MLTTRHRAPLTLNKVSARPPALLRAAGLLLALPQGLCFSYALCLTFSTWFLHCPPSSPCWRVICSVPPAQPQCNSQPAPNQLHPHAPLLHTTPQHPRKSSQASNFPAVPGRIAGHSIPSVSCGAGLELSFPHLFFFLMVTLQGGQALSRGWPQVSLVVKLHWPRGSRVIY